MARSDIYIVRRRQSDSIVSHCVIIDSLRVLYYTLDLRAVNSDHTNLLNKLTLLDSKIINYYGQRIYMK